MARSNEHLRLTPQRNAILREVQTTTMHPTADDIYRRVRRRLPRISLGTVYRNLMLLVEMGLVRRITSGTGPMRFDATMTVHTHLRCLACGRLDDAPAGLTPNLDKQARHVKNYRITGYSLEFVGYCAKCRRDERIARVERSGTSK